MIICFQNSLNFYTENWKFLFKNYTSKIFKTLYIINQHSWECFCVSSRQLSLFGGQNSRWFSHPDVIWAPLPCSSALVGEPGMGLRLHAPVGEPFQLTDPSRISATCGTEAIPFCISALPISLNVASSVKFGLWSFCSASLQLVIQVDCSVF